MVAGSREQVADLAWTEAEPTPSERRHAHNARRGGYLMGTGAAFMLAGATSAAVFGRAGALCSERDARVASAIPSGVVFAAAGLALASAGLVTWRRVPQKARTVTDGAGVGIVATSVATVLGAGASLTLLNLFFAAGCASS